MRKFICIGDVHASFDLAWEALRSASCADKKCQPTPPVINGSYQVVFIGDLVHPKSLHAYSQLTGLGSFDQNDSEHLFLAARAQMLRLETIKRYQEAAPSSVHMILGNHDANVLDHAHLLGTGRGLRHMEFDHFKGGLAMSSHLYNWFGSFLRELRIGSIQFAHVSPMPAHQIYDDLFYSDRSAKTWFIDSPEYIEMAGLSFGVYGHTQTNEGVKIYKTEAGVPRFAMIDALNEREYLEILYDTAASAIVGVNAVAF